MRLINRKLIGAGGNGLLTNLLNCWEMNDASGDLVDAHGTDDLATSSIGYGATGIIGDAISVNADTDYARKNSYNPVSGSGTRTISTWVYYGSSSTSNTLFSYGDISTGARFCVRFNGTSLRFEIQGSGYTSSLTGATGAWHHAVVVFDGTTLADATLYLNGSSEACTGANSVNTAVSSAAAGFTINEIADNSGRGIGSGSYDQTAIWSRALSADDVAALYNSGSGLAYSSFTS